MCAEILADLQLSTVNTPVIVTPVIFPPGILPAAPYAPSPVMSLLQADIVQECDIIEQITFQGHTTMPVRIFRYS